ncbi:hypothetical protein RND81_10G213400 [Saponaria officinalis]|uniref:Uncharacterized protein n=1 Tax=Saponaria officinalis TaxID=3572 RepID=A0AAW1I597_SAPOF
MEPRSVAENDAIKHGAHPIPEDRLRSSSASSGSVESESSDYSFEDSYQLDVNEHGSFALDHDQTNTTTPRSKSTLETPPIQLMERPSDASAYRIPSHVFARDKSSNPNPEWSIASNDSLFSIQTGNMSFTKDQFSSLLKSGDLGMYTPGDFRKSGELPPPSPKIPASVHKSGERIPQTPSDTSKSGEQIIADHFKASATPAAPVETTPVTVVVTSPPKVNEDDVNPQLTVKTKQDDLLAKKNDRSSMSDEVPPSTSVSHQSDTSVQSFAFPVFAEIEREKSINSGQSRTEQQKKTSNGVDQKTPTSTTPTTAPASWFSCFSCCSCR